MHVGAIFYNLGVKNQDRKLKFGASNVLIELYNIYSGFLEIPKILDFISCFPKNIVFWIFRGEKRILWKIRDSHFKELVELRLVMSLICNLLKTLIYGDFLNIYHFFTENAM